MSPITHFLCGWAVANSAPLKRRDRALVTAAGVLPDADGLSLFADFVAGHDLDSMFFFARYHHTLGHNIGMAIVVLALVLAFAERRILAAWLAAIAFHVHLLGDLVGARGPDGSQWPVPYLLPFSDRPSLVWQGQWALNAWPNFLITGALLALVFFLAWKRGYSPLEIISARADAAFVTTLRRRFGQPRML